jgi:hypothetical protein
VPERSTSEKAYGKTAQWRDRASISGSVRAASALGGLTTEASTAGGGINRSSPLAIARSRAKCTAVGAAVVNGRGARWRAPPRTVAAPPFDFCISARSATRAPGTRFGSGRCHGRRSDASLRAGNDRPRRTVGRPASRSALGPRSASRRAAAHRFGALVAEAERRAMGIAGDLRDGWRGAPRSTQGPDLRPYQSQALAAWAACDRRGVIVLPTGAGKTRVAIAAILEAGVPSAVLCPNSRACRGVEGGARAMGRNDDRPRWRNLDEPPPRAHHRLRGARGYLSAG